MEYLVQFVKSLINVDPATLNQWADVLGPWLYGALFLIIFAETGLVVTPFLPGDSLLFAVGAMAAHPSSPISLWTTAALLIVAAVLGDAINYAFGYRAGPRVFTREDSWLLNKKHLLRAHEFYEEYGGLTIILARFMPIVRTFAPFVAGIGRMTYARFAVYNVAGGTAWILSFLLAGWWFGGRKVVQENFKLVMLAIIVISVLPACVGFVRSRLTRARRARLIPEPIVEGESAPDRGD
jgi:membrane-associated protein